MSLFMLGGSFHQVSASPVSGAVFALNDGDNATIGLGYAYLNSNGANPLSTSDSWFWCSSCGSDLAFQAVFGSGLYSNAAGRNDTLQPFGVPDTTSYGEV